MEANRFTQKSMESLQSCQQIAQSYGNAQVEQLHLLCALLTQENGLIGQLVEKLGVNLRQLQSACNTAVSRLPKIAGSNQQPHVSAGLATVLAGRHFPAMPEAAVASAICCVWHSISGTLLAGIFNIIDRWRKS